MKNKLRNEVCSWGQVLGIACSIYFVYNDHILRSIHVLLCVLVLEFVCKDRKDD